MNPLEDIMKSPVNRRAFLTQMGAAGLGVAAVSLLAGCGSRSGSLGTVATSPDTNLSVIDPMNFPGIKGRNINQVVLNYALSLEILEADLYRQALNAASGRPLSAPLDSSLPAPGTFGAYSQVVGNGSIASQFAAPAFLYLVQFAYVEAAHRDFLLTALGADARPAKPASGNYKFATSDGKPGSDLSSILTNVLPLEEAGTRAYLGALPFLTDLSLAQVAGTIYSTECRHSASLEYILGLDPGPSRNIPGVPTPEQEVQSSPFANTFEKYLAPPVVLNAVVSAFFA